ncbi:MAG: hypothetical protein CM1200mP5_2600 [Candidatus Pelagibacterales bacterium]|nr:MAG: hypothetical protein CM1200mP5_2600 [Pelagibacterales bacterium]
MISEEDKIMMETYIGGVYHLFRCKNDPDPKNCDIALVGVPHRQETAQRKRSAFGSKSCKKYICNA